MSDLTPINYNIAPNQEQTNVQASPCTEENFFATSRVENAETYTDLSIFSNSIIENNSDPTNYVDDLMMEFLTLEEEMGINSIEYTSELATEAISATEQLVVMENEPMPAPENISDVENIEETEDITKIEEIKEAEEVEENSEYYMANNDKNEFEYPPVEEVNWTTYFGYLPELGENIANGAKNHPYPNGDGSHCLAGVAYMLGHAFKDAGIEISPLTGKEGVSSAYQAVAALRGEKPTEGFYAEIGDYYQEYTGMPRSYLEKLPPGCIVVWNQCSYEHEKDHDHGHISISLGNGAEISDIERTQSTDLCRYCEFPEDEWEFVVYMPVGSRSREV